MKNLISLYLLLCSFVASAQYHPTAVEGRRWNQHLHQITPFFPGMSYHEFRGDTLYKGKSMKKLISVDAKGNFKSLDALVFEDTTTPALTFFYPQAGLFGDSVYFNLNLNIGDSLMVQCGGDTGYYRADSISFITDLTSIQRKQHHFSFKMPQYNFGSFRTYFNWIEGFGDIQGFVGSPVPGTCFSDPLNVEVTCIFDSTTQLYQNPNFSICDGISLTEIKNQTIEVFPNPAFTFLEIQNLRPEEVQSIQMVNSEGVVVMEVSKPVENQIDIQQLPQGLYVLQISLKGSKGFTRKFVKGR